MSDSELKSNHIEAATPEVRPETSAYHGQPDDLHDLFATEAGDDEDPLAAMRNDPNYAALIHELEYIAVEARKIFAAAEQDPSDKVWDRLKIEMESETE